MHYQITRLEITPDGWNMARSIAEPGFEPDELIGRLQQIIKELERLDATSAPPVPRETP